MWTKKTVFIIFATLLIGFFVIPNISYAREIVDSYKAGPADPGATASDGTTKQNLVERLIGGKPTTELASQAAQDALDQQFAENAAKASKDVAINIAAANDEALAAIAKNYIASHPEYGLTEEELVAKLSTARAFLKSVWDNDDFIKNLVEALAKIAEKNPVPGEGASVEARLRFVKNIFELVDENGKVKDVADARTALLANTRFVTFLLGKNALDADLAQLIGETTGNQKEELYLMSHAGTNKGQGASIYETLAHLLGYANHADNQEALDGYRAGIEHELTDLILGRHDVASANKPGVEATRKINQEILAKSAQTVASTRKIFFQTSQDDLIELAKEKIAPNVQTIFDNVIAVDGEKIKGHGKPFIEFVAKTKPNEAVVAVFMNTEALNAAKVAFLAETKLNLEDLVHLFVLGEKSLQKTGQDELRALFADNALVNGEFSAVKIGDAVQSHKTVAIAIGSGV